MVLCELAYIFVGLSLLYWWFSNRKSSLSTFPGPPGLPLLGNVHEIDLKLPHLTCMEWQKQYGEIFRIKVLGKESLVVSSFETIYEVLVTKGADFAGRPRAFRLGYISFGYKDISVANPDPRWNLLRKTAHKQLKMYDTGLQRLESISMDIIGDLVRTFKNHKGKPFDPKQSIYNAVVNTIALLLIGKKFPVTSKEFQLIVACEKNVRKNMTPIGWGVELDIFPWLRYFGNSTFRELKTFVQTFDKLYNILKEHLEGNVGEEGNYTEGVMHFLMKLYLSQSTEDKMSPTGLDEEHIKAVVLDFIFAGSTTTTYSFYSYMKLISHHPEVQKKLQEEVDEKVGDNRLVSVTDRTNMPYTRATLLELLRYTSIVGMGIPHQTVRDTSIGGKHIPAGTRVFANLYGLHHDEDFWDQPFEFKPDRFLDEDGEVVSASNELRRHLMPFGAGTRVCLGEVLAHTRLFLLIATMSQVFEVKPGPGNVSYDSRDYDSGIIQRQKNYEVYLKSRNKV